MAMPSTTTAITEYYRSSDNGDDGNARYHFSPVNNAFIKLKILAPPHVLPDFIRSQGMGLSDGIRRDGNFLIRPDNHELPGIRPRHHFNRATEHQDVGLQLRYVDLQDCILGLYPGMQCLDVVQTTRCVRVCFAGIEPVDAYRAG